MANRKISIYKYVRLGKNWRYCKPVVGANNKNQTVTLSEAPAVEIWILPAEELITRGCGAVKWELKREEWVRNFDAKKYLETCSVN